MPIGAAQHGRGSMLSPFDSSTPSSCISWPNMLPSWGDLPLPQWVFSVTAPPLTADNAMPTSVPDKPPSEMDLITRSGGATRKVE